MKCINVEKPNSLNWNYDTVPTLTNKLTESHKISKLNEDDLRARRFGSLIKRKKSATIACCRACMDVAKLNFYSSQQYAMHDVFGFNVFLRFLSLCNRVYVAQVGLIFCSYRRCNCIVVVLSVFTTGCLF